MGHERWFRGQHDGQGRPFDWRAAARQHGIPEQLARALYERAVREARGATQVEEIYLGLLANARPDASRPSPGKVTRTMRLETERAARQRRHAARSPIGHQPVAPGKRTLTSYIEPARNEKRVLDAQRMDARRSEQDVPVSDALSERTLQAQLAAAFGHVEALDALDEARIAAAPETAIEAAWRLDDMSRAETADPEQIEVLQPSAWLHGRDGVTDEQRTGAGRPVDDWGQKSAGSLLTSDL